MYFSTLNADNDGDSDFSFPDGANTILTKDPKNSPAEDHNCDQHLPGFQKHSNDDNGSREDSH